MTPFVPVEILALLKSVNKSYLLGLFHSTDTKYLYDNLSNTLQTL